MVNMFSDFMAADAILEGVGADFIYFFAGWEMDNDTVLIIHTAFDGGWVTAVSEEEAIDKYYQYVDVDKYSELQNDLWPPIREENYAL
ncbi:MAG: hypothetical protein U9Q82_10065 [Chloroflexota bacterium]|nr:hypothetical protein [Chloroflexota bacterium]